MSHQVRARGLIFGNLLHAIEGDIPAHTHDASFYHLVLAGNYEESSPRGRICFQPLSSAFTHSGTKHDGRVAPGGMRLFTIEIGNAWIKELLDVRPEPETVHDCVGNELTCRGIQLFREYQDGADNSLAVDALIWELLAAAAGLEPPCADRPGWWNRVVDLLHAEFRRDLRISELAAEADVHPVYLARVFRRVLRQTPGEYAQRLRVKFASERLSLPGEGIAEIAAQAGFADQSHLGRIFKRYTGMTPGEFRAVFAASHV
jgi:AraC family transcriptional regulator